MRDKAPLALMEQAVMLLVFAMAAAVCVQAFAWCGTQSRRIERRAAAMSVAASVADAMQSGDKDALVRLGLPGIARETDGSGHVIIPRIISDGLPCPMRVRVSYGDRTDFLWTARIKITDEDGTVLATLDVAGQEG